MLYIKKFDTLSAQTEYFNSAEIDTYVGYVVENDTVYYDDANVIDYAKKYFTIETLEDGVLTFKGSNNTLYYSLDKTTWNPITSADTISFHAGDNIMLKGTNMTATSSAGIGTIKFSGNHNVYGNISTLIEGDEFPQQIAYSTNQFRALFNGDSKLISAENLILSATTLASACYSYMFWNCTSLTTAPQLLATTLANQCYDAMFYGCTSLTTAPSVLPATTLANQCYSDMFWGCRSLTTAPQLPATTLASQCYSSMFSDCKNLTAAPELPATTLAYGCYYSMFYGCTSLTVAPALPATTLAKGCYTIMFRDCTSLSYVKMMAFPVDSANTANWLIGVASSGTLVTYCDTTLPSGASGLPNGWTQVKQDYDGSECSTNSDMAN